MGKPPHHYRVDYRDDLTVSGRKKPIDFRTLGLRVEMNYRNLLHRLGKDYVSHNNDNIEFENKMMNQIKPTIPGSPDVFVR